MFFCKWSVPFFGILLRYFVFYVLKVMTVYLDMHFSLFTLGRIQFASWLCGITSINSGRHHPLFPNYISSYLCSLLLELQLDEFYSFSFCPPCFWRASYFRILDSNFLVKFFGYISHCIYSSFTVSTLLFKPSIDLKWNNYTFHF